MRNELILRKNEYEANIYASNILRVSCLFLILTQVLNSLDIFIIEKNIMLFSTVSNILLLLIPTLLIDVLKIEKSYIKYIVITCCTLVVSNLNITLSYHAILLYIFPISIACLYFSRKVTIFALVEVVVFVSFSQVISYNSKFLVDSNLRSMQSNFLYAIFPRMIETIVVTIVFVGINERTSKLLNNIIKSKDNAEQVLTKIKYISNDAEKVSENLFSNLELLSEVKERIYSSHNINPEEYSSADKNINKILNSENNLKLIYNKVLNITDKSKKISIFLNMLKDYASKCNLDISNKVIITNQNINTNINKTNKSEENSEKVSKPIIDVNESFIQNPLQADALIKSIDNISILSKINIAYDMADTITNECSEVLKLSDKLKEVADRRLARLKDIIGATNKEFQAINKLAQLGSTIDEIIDDLQEIVE